MIKNYLLISIRNLGKHFTYSVINIFGLGLGMATCLLLVAWISHELSFDRFHEKSDRIYRASLEYSFGGQTEKTAVSPTALLPLVKSNFAEVEDGVRLYNPSAWNPFVVRNDDALFQEAKFFYADSSFFNVFSFKLSKGDPLHVLSTPKTVVLSEAMAKKYFGTNDPVGKVLLINNKDEYTVTGVVENVPSNSLLQFDFIASFSSLKAASQRIWWSANYETYFLLSPTADVKNLSLKTNKLVAEELKSELASPGDYVIYNFMPLTDIYLKSNMNENSPVGDIQYIYIFGGIALLVLLIGCINYINLATAKAADRAKEVGMRKVIGATRNQLFIQFIGESAAVTFLGLILAFLLALLTLPLFNMLTGKYFTSTAILNPTFISISILASIFISIVAGAYPAFAITSFKPVSILKGNFKTSGKGIWLRQSLVIFQFSVSIILIIGTLVIVKQVNFIQNKKLGFDKENTIVIPLDGKTENIYSTLKTELLKGGEVISLARATESPTSINGGYSITVGNAPNGMIVRAMSVDPEFVPTVGMKIISGRNFTETDFKTAKTDSMSSFLLNESAVQELGMNVDKAIGTRANLNGRKGTIVGIIKDFHFASLHEKITPLVLFNEEQQYSYMFIKLKEGDLKQSLTNIKKTYSTLVPHRPFEYKFLDEQYATLYASEEKVTSISMVFAILTIVIACMGLLGLVAYSASQKIKEIGIRKVLGASAQSIILLITKDYARLVIIAIITGIPVACYLMQNFWLSEFAYRVSIGVWPPVIASVMCIIIAFAAATYQAVKAAFINPVKALRNE